MAHGLQLERSDDRRNRWRPGCRCGWVGDWTSSQQRARDQYAAHRDSTPSPRRRPAEASAEPVKQA